MIDYLEDKVTEHFFWREVLFLSKWQVYVVPETTIHKNNIIDTCKKLEAIREIFNAPLHITSFYRPGIYNSLIGGARGSAHKEGLAADFIINGFDSFQSCNEVRYKLLPHLEKLEIRVENNPVSNWVHIDLREPGPSGRFFKP